MWRFLRRLAAFGSIQIVIAAVWWTHHEPFAEDYMAASIDKHARLERESPPRLIIVGGSAAAFGFDGGLIESRVALTPVNMALHFSVGSAFMLREIRDSIRPGDVVLLALEYGHFADHANGAGALVDLLGHWPAGIRYVDWRQIRLLSDQALPYLATQLRIDLRRATGRLRPPNLPYRRSAFNEYGDVVEHWGHAPRSHNLNFELGHVSESGLYEMSLRVGELASFAIRQGATVFLSFPPIPADACESFRGDLARIRAATDQIVGVRRLGPNEPGCYPRSLFFDTYYHLNRDGARRRSEELVKALLANGVNSRDTEP